MGRDGVGRRSIVVGNGLLLRARSDIQQRQVEQKTSQNVLYLALNRLSSVRVSDVRISPTTSLEEGDSVDQGRVRPSRGLIMVSNCES